MASGTTNAILGGGTIVDVNGAKYAPKMSISAHDFEAYKYPAAGGNIGFSRSPLRDPAHLRIKIETDYIYYLGSGTNILYKLNRANGTVVSLDLGGSGATDMMVVDSTSIYVIRYNGQTLTKINKATLTVTTTVATHSGYTYQTYIMGFDGTYIYTVGYSSLRSAFAVAKYNPSDLSLVLMGEGISFGSTDYPFLIAHANDSFLRVTKAGDSTMYTINKSTLALHNTGNYGLSNAFYNFTSLGTFIYEGGQSRFYPWNSASTYESYVIPAGNSSTSYDSIILADGSFVFFFQQSESYCSQVGARTFGGFLHYTPSVNKYPMTGAWPAINNGQYAGTYLSDPADTSGMTAFIVASGQISRITLLYAPIGYQKIV